jgi:hypothetical protein
MTLKLCLLRLPLANFIERGCPSLVPARMPATGVARQAREAINA